MSSASKRSPSAVDPTRSQNKAVMTLRSSRTGVASSLVPQSPQNRLSSGFSAPQEGQTSIGGEPTSGARNALK